MPDNFYGGLDFGTSGARISIIDLHKELVYSNSVPYLYNFEKQNSWINSKYSSSLSAPPFEWCPKSLSGIEYITKTGKYGCARFSNRCIELFVFLIVLLGPTPNQKAIGSLVISRTSGYLKQTSSRLFQSG